MSRSPLFGLAAVLSLATTAGPAAAQLISTRVGSGFGIPVAAVSSPGDPGRLFVAELSGQIRRFDPATGAIDSTPVLNLQTLPGANLIFGDGDRGLLGLAPHPDFSSNGHFFVNYTAGTTATSFSRVERYTYNFATRTADPASRQTVLVYDQPAVYHCSNWLGFHPTNGLLHIASGSGDLNDLTNRGQALNTWFGKVLRIDVSRDDFPSDLNRNYAIPASNPFVGTAGVRPEIFAYGLRNPWRAGFDRANGDLYIGDVGQSNREEVNFIASASRGGQNFGWATREGTLGPPLPGSTDPVYEFEHGGGPGDQSLRGNSVTGGYVYRGGLLLDRGQPLDGTYFFGDFVTGSFWSFRYDGTALTDFRVRTGELRRSADGFTIDYPVSFAEDGRGNLYVLDYTGEIFRIDAVAVPEPGALALTGAAVGAWWLRRRRRPARPSR